MRALSLCAVLFILVPRLSLATQRQWTEEQLKEFSDRQTIINPKGDNVYQKVQDIFGKHGPYTDAQVVAALNAKKKIENVYHPELLHQIGKVPVDAFLRSTVLQQLADYERTLLEPKKLLAYTAPPSPEHPNGVKLEVNSLQEALDQKYGVQVWYKRDQILDVESNGIAPGKIERERPSDDPIAALVEAGSKNQTRTLMDDFKTPRLRQSWRDVLYEEDPSQLGNDGKALKDLVGMTFSYSRNAAADSDTWTTLGAVIFPWEHDFPLTGGLLPARIAIAPSMTINRVDTNGDPKTESDSVLYRLGIYSDWRFFRMGSDGALPPPWGLQVRAAFVYATDTGHDASLPGYEFDLEPHWQNGYFPLAYKKVLLRKQTIKDDRSDWSRLEYVLRTWVHVEGGDVQDNGKSWDPTKGAFFRVGPTVQLQLNAPRLLLGKDASLTALYSYLPAISGNDQHESYFKVSGAYDLVKDDVLNHKIAITLQYERGGLNFTKEDVDLFTIGLGVLF
jgi:hypothetical protein